MDSEEVADKATEEGDCDFEEEGAEEEPLEDDAYLELDSDTYECVQDIDLGVKLGFTPKKTNASDTAVAKPSTETSLQTVPKPSEDPPLAPPSGMVSSCLDSTLFNSHLSPVKPRPTDTPVKQRSENASATPGSPVKAVVPQPQPNLAEPMEAADSRVERLARIALLKFSARIGNGFLMSTHSLTYSHD